MIKHMIATAAVALVVAASGGVANAQVWSPSPFSGLIKGTLTLEQTLPPVTCNVSGLGSGGYPVFTTGTTTASTTFSSFPFSLCPFPLGGIQAGGQLSFSIIDYDTVSIVIPPVTALGGTCFGGKIIGEIDSLGPPLEIHIPRQSVPGEDFLGRPRVCWISGDVYIPGLSIV